VLKSVLVVDDNAFIRQVLCRVFTSEAGFDVCGEAENGRDAIEKAQVLHPDLIVMDLSMPVMNGIDAAHGDCTRKAIRVVMALPRQGSLLLLGCSRV
jgi:chemotaxis response regulator CheB